jgi:hypothetical protein
MDDRVHSEHCASNGVCDFLRYVGDASYAVMPKDLAHQVGEMKKNFLSGFRWLIDKQIQWVDARVEGGDRLREEWQRGAGQRPKESEGSGI